MHFPKVSGILASLLLFLFETSTIKIAEVANSHFWTNLAEIAGFFYFWSASKIVFRQSLFSKNSPEYPEATDMFWIEY